MGNRNFGACAVDLREKGPVAGEKRGELKFIRGAGFGEKGEVKLTFSQNWREELNFRNSSEEAREAGTGYAIEVRKQAGDEQVAGGIEKQFVDEIVGTGDAKLLVYGTIGVKEDEAGAVKIIDAIEIAADEGVFCQRKKAGHEIIRIGGEADVEVRVRITG